MLELRYKGGHKNERLYISGAVYTIDHELVPRKMPYFAVRVHGLHFMVRVLQKLFYKAIGLLTKCKPNVDQEKWPCGKKWMCWVFLIHAQKGQFWRKKLKFDYFLVFSWASLVFHLMLDVSKMWLANLLTTFFSQKNERFDLYMFNVIYMWLVSCVITAINRIFSLWLYQMLFLPYLAQHQFSILWKPVLEYFARRYIGILLLSFFSYPYQH